MSFLNKYTFRCLLGPRSKDVHIIDDMYFWKVGDRKHFGTSRTLLECDIDLLKSKHYYPFSFHYLSVENTAILKSNFQISKSKDKCVIVDITDLSLKGGKFKKVRQAINKCKENDFEILDNFKKIEDVEQMLDEWSNNYTDKYFRDFSGKNLFFYKNNFHKNCNNIFIYHKNDLVSFGSLSPNNNGKSSYIIGKALYKRFRGLSELTDIELYKKAFDKGIFIINMGRSSNKRLHFYKSKFPTLKEEVCYSGKIKV